MQQYHGLKITDTRPISIDLDLLDSTQWEPATEPTFEYFEIDGNEASPKMKYEHEMKVRAEFWSHIHDEIHTKFNYLSGTPPKTMDELSIFSAKRPKEDL